MAITAGRALVWFFEHYHHHAPLQQLKLQLPTAAATPDAIRQLLAIYTEAIPIIEQLNWLGALDESTLDHYQQLYRELEQLLAQHEPHTRNLRHKFVITIPVADRPQHLQECLNSLLTLCQKFHYGGFVAGRYPGVMVLIADDSREPSNMIQHRELAEHFTGAGLEILYFGLDEQLQQLDRLSATERQSLHPVLGDIDRNAFYHKGASIMRNISYLKLHELSRAASEPLLCYFIDSDQEFRIKLDSLSGDRDLYALSFLHKLDEIFRQTEATIVTGKVVGDPPVSPAVMAANFLEDVVAFLQQIDNLPAEHACGFHTPTAQRVDDAAYHDMADLFGFKSATTSFSYRCNLSGTHNSADCFRDFANKLNRFFDGEHPTRKTYYEHAELLTTITPARTIYTGNYIFRPAALDYFIPFANLKLRMAGPVLGRLIKAELGNSFVSANLPMLHKRTVHESGCSEFRPGINRQEKLIDLSGEFERQFFGDVMLFTIDELTQHGYPASNSSRKEVTTLVNKIEAQLQQKYHDKQQQIIQKIARLDSLFNDPDKWWHNDKGLQDARDNLNLFINNMRHNFGDGAAGYQLITSESRRQKRLAAIVTAIISYPADRAHWYTTLNNQQNCS
jgi:hypothetical protein